MLFHIIKHDILIVGRMAKSPKPQRTALRSTTEVLVQVLALLLPVVKPRTPRFTVLILGFQVCKRAKDYYQCFPYRDVIEIK